MICLGFYLRPILASSPPPSISDCLKPSLYVHSFEEVALSLNYFIVFVASMILRSKKTLLENLSSPVPSKAQLKTHLTQNLKDYNVTVKTSTLRAFINDISLSQTSVSLCLKIRPAQKTILASILMTASVLCLIPKLESLQVELQIESELVDVDVTSSLGDLLAGCPKCKFLSVSVTCIARSLRFVEEVVSLITFQNTQLKYLLISGTGCEETASVIRGVGRMALTNLQISSLSQEVAEGIKRLELGVLGRLCISLDGDNDNIPEENTLKTRLVCEILDLTPEIYELELNINNLNTSQLCKCLSQRPYLSSLKSKSELNFTEEDLFLLLQHNFFLTQLSTHFSHLRKRTQKIFMLIRQRKRILQTQMMSISAMEASFQHLLATHHIVDILQSQTLIIL